MKNYFLAFLLMTSSAVAQNKAGSGPNILFIPVDDLRPELGCYGNMIIKTPNIDKLAKAGVVFNRAYCQQAVCNPSRASLLSGLRPDNLRVWDLMTEFRNTARDVVTLPQYFKGRGYTTINLGKAFHNIFPDSLSWTEDLHVEGFPFDPDAVYAGEENLQIIETKKQKMITNGQNRIDRFGKWYVKARATDKAIVGDDVYYDGAQTSKAVEILQQLKKGQKPFFLSVGYYKPHLPFNAPQKYWDLYNGTKIPIAANEFMPEATPSFAVHGDQELRSYDDFKDLPFPHEAPLSVDRQAELLHGYYACVSYIDAQIGRLMTELEKLGLADNTIVVLWGDHGWKLGEHNSWAKQSNFEVDTRVPLIISGKGVKAKGSASNALVELLDIYPTLCDIAETPVPANLQGLSMKPLLTNPDLKWKDAAYSQFLLGRFGPKETRKTERMGYSVRTGQFRYTEWYAWKDDIKGEWLATELYDHDTDPDENKNVAGSAVYTKDTERLKKYLHSTSSPFLQLRDAQ